MSIDKFTKQQWLNSGLFISFWILTPSISCAQVVGDGTLSTSVTSSNNIEFTINGGSKAGNNLFHSFSKFSIPENGSAIFNQPLNGEKIENIISRVTGGSISTIDGVIKAGGNANLFLINPNGIVFGPNASLDIKGSFMATTANRLNFDDGKYFSAKDTSAQPLLSVGVPIGLQFGETVGDISLVGENTKDNLLPSLGVEPGKTLTLVGGNVSLEAGTLFAPAGRIEIGSVGAFGTVQIAPISTGWKLNYDSGQNLQDIRLSQVSVVDTSGNGNGDIQLYGRQIAIASDSQVGGFNLGDTPRGTTAIRASELVELSGNSSSLFNNSDPDNPETAPGGDIVIDTKRLLVSNGADINTASANSKPGGKITINAPESVEVNGNGSTTQITTQAFASGDAGDVRINTGSLTIYNGGQIGGSTTGAGNGGSVVINATNYVEVRGQAEGNPSGLFARTRRSATGDGGIIKIDTGRLIIQNGGTVSVEATDNSTGQAGTLDINAINSVEVTGRGSSLKASSNSPSPAGNLTINTGDLIVQDGAEVSVSSTNIGDAGNLQVHARTISLDNQGKVTSTSELGTGGGNISLQRLNSLTLRRGSEISTSAQGEGNGGDITISTNLLTALENSNIRTTAESGRGGKITITTQGLFLSPDSRIDASSDRGVDGVVEIDRLENNPENALLTLPAEPVNISGLIAQGCSSGAGSIARRGSEFVVTGRGGLPPNPQEAIRSDVALADLGSPIQPEASQAKVVTATNQNTSKLTELVEAQGWVIGSQGEVILTASVPNVTPSIPWMKSNSCHG